MLQVVCGGCEGVVTQHLTPKLTAKIRSDVGNHDCNVAELVSELVDASMIPFVPPFINKPRKIQRKLTDVRVYGRFKIANGVLVEVVRLPDPALGFA